MKIGITYSVVTPESAQDGDVAEAGWVFEPIEATLREVAEELSGRCIVHVHQSQTGLSFYCEPTLNYCTGESTEETVHVSDIHPLAYNYLITAFKA